MISKFRAWHKKEKKMGKVIQIQTEDAFHGGQKVQVLGMLDKEVLIKDVILMQSTGLKDKNGKEIFEGDIVKFGNIIDEVYWDKGSFWVHYFRIGSNEDIIILGNIHENPELMSEKNTKVK